MLNPHRDDDLGILLSLRGMNRSRCLSDYQTTLDLDIYKIACRHIDEKGFFKWYDLCCGDFLVRSEFLSTYPSLEKKVEIVGVDLDVRSEGVIRRNVRNFPIPQDADLVTCIEGLTYIQAYLKKSFETIKNWCSRLQESALLSFDASKYILYSQINVPKYLRQDLGLNVSIYPVPGWEKTHQSVQVVRNIS